MGLIPLALARDLLQVTFHHITDKFLEADLVAPPQPLACLAGVAEQEVDFGWPKVARIDLDDAGAGLGVVPLLLGTLAAPNDLTPDMLEAVLDEFAHRMHFPGREHVVVGLLLLKHQPHATHVVLGVSPVALGIEIAEIEPFLAAEMYRCGSTR